MENSQNIRDPGIIFHAKQIFLLHIDYNVATAEVTRILGVMNLHILKTLIK